MSVAQRANWENPLRKWENEKYRIVLRRWINIYTIFVYISLFIFLEHVAFVLISRKELDFYKKLFEIIFYRHWSL